MEYLELGGYSDERFQMQVHEDLHCPICMNVFNDPVHCGPNEHYFCRKCITTQLKHCEKCPSCKNNLSLPTLALPSRFVTNRLSQLIIHCDNLDRGCQDFLELGLLSDHVKTCRFTPIQCSNKGCSTIVNRNDHENHAKRECEFREKCIDCDGLREELEKVKKSLEAVTENLRRVCETKQAPTAATHLNYVRQDFVIMGGFQVQRKPLDDVDIFHWSTNKWESLKPMQQARLKASSFVYKGQVVVSGGLVRDVSHHSGVGLCKSMEKMSFTPETALEWSGFSGKLPTKRSAHKCLVYRDRLLVIGGYDDKQGKYSDAIHEVRLQPPYTSQVVARMPYQRSYFGAELFGDKVVIAGGTSTGLVDHCVSSVVEYDIGSKICRELPGLPYKVTGMATVAWQGKLVIIGGANKGWNKDGERLDSVVLYDVETGQNTMLPSMKNKRLGASAIVTGDVIVVMGGVNDAGRLDSVECFNFYTYAWKELPPLMKPRSYASAVLKPH